MISEVRVFTKEIHNCGECPNCEWDICYEVGKKVDINTLPSWCPLEKFTIDNEFCQHACSNRSGDTCCSDTCSLQEYMDWINNDTNTN